MGTATVEGSTQRLTKQARVVIATLLVAAFVVILNETIMSVALPHLMTSLDISASTAQWLSSAFMLTMAVVIPTTGFLLQRIPTRTVFILAMSLFCTGTLLAGLSPAFWMLLPARVVQASGTAMMIPLLMTSILTLVPFEHRGVVMGNVSIAISVAPAIGPTISGLILQFLPWRFMFLLVLPIALMALVIGAKLITDVGERGSQRLDLSSVLLTIPAFGGVVYALSQFAVSTGSGLVIAVVLLVVGIACLLIFGRRQVWLQEHGDPLLDLRVFRIPMFRLSLILLCVAMVALFGALILLPLYFQSVRGLTSLETGLLLLPGGLLMGLLGPVVGKVFDRFGPKVLMPPGAALLVLTLLGLTQVNAHTSVWFLLALHLVLSLGFATLFTPGFTTALNPLPPSLYSHGSATLATLQQVAGAAGTAALVAIMAGRAAGVAGRGVDPVSAQVAGLHTAFLVAAIVGVVAVVLAVFIRNDAPEGGPAGHGPTVPATEGSEEPVGFVH